MIVSEKKLENARIELQIEVPENQVENEYIKVFDKLQKNLKLDGFRKGKAPIEIITKKFKNNADSEVAENIIKAAYYNAINEKEFSPISQPEFNFDKIERSKSFTFNVKFDIPPTITLGNYKKLDVNENSYNITDKDVENEIQSLREKNANVSRKEKDERVEIGDFIKAEVKRIDNLDENETEKAQTSNISTIIGKQKTEYGFDDDIIGMKVDDTKELIREYPKDYQESSVAGQKVKYLLKITEINKLTLPDLDDEFAKDLGDYTSIENLKKKIRENLENLVISKSKRDTKDILIKNIIENSSFDLPESLIITEMANLITKFKANTGLEDKRIDELFEKKLLDKEKFYSKIREDAVLNIKSTLVLLEIAKQENISITEERYKDIIKSYAETNKIDKDKIDEIEKQFQENGTKQNIQTELLVADAAELIYNNAVIKKREAASFEEFMK